MIHPSTQIQYLDIKVGEPRYKTINDLYQEYCHKAIDVISNKEYKVGEIDFSETADVKITELFGWTDIIMLRKCQYLSSDINWINIIAANKNVLVSDKSLIPFYEVDNTTRGFHGEVKHKYILKNPTKSVKGDYLRLHGGEDEKGNSIEFTNKILINPHHGYNVSYGYEIITKSRFVNGNDIHLLACDSISIEEASSWYK